MNPLISRSTSRNWMGAMALLAALASSGPTYALDHSFEVLHSMNYEHGGYVRGPLVAVPDGAHYGTSPYAGKAFSGIIFRLLADGEFEVVYHFKGASEADGNSPEGLVMAEDGRLYGVTRYGGDSDCGLAYRLRADDTIERLHSFTVEDGCQPRATLLAARDGFLYGTSVGGHGKIFRLSRDGELVVMHSFRALEDGDLPWGRLMQGSDGMIYGTTRYGGPRHLGTVFRMDPADGTLVTLHNFNGDDGSQPITGLTEGPDGRYYGVSTGERKSGNATGLIYRIDGTGQLEVVHRFNGPDAQGKHPMHELLLGRDGAFYGSTESGGIEGYGTIFRWSLDGTYSRLRSLSHVKNDGNWPANQLVEAADGQFLGATRLGGRRNAGTLYRVTVLAE